MSWALTDITEPRVSPPAWKEITDEQGAFVAGSSLIFLLSCGVHAAPDVSPRGDAAGFVRVVERNRLHLPDRIGNNRLDTMQNTLANSRVTILFLCRDNDRVLSVSGSAEIRTEPDLLETFSVKGRPPRSVMEIGILSATFMDAPALAASGLWMGGSTESGTSIASLGEILADQVGGMTKEEGEAFIANSYANKLY